MYPAALHKFPAQTVDLLQIFERRILQRQREMINKMTKSWDRIQSAIWNRFVRTGPRFHLSIAVVKDKFPQINIIFLIIHLFRRINFTK